MREIFSPFPEVPIPTKFHYNINNNFIHLNRKWFLRRGKWKRQNQKRKWKFHIDTNKTDFWISCNCVSPYDTFGKCAYFVLYKNSYWLQMAANNVNSPWKVFKHLVYFKTSISYKLCYNIRIYTGNTIFVWSRWLLILAFCSNNIFNFIVVILNLKGNIDKPATELGMTEDNEYDNVKRIKALSCPVVGDKMKSSGHSFHT